MTRQKILKTIKLVIVTALLTAAAIYVYDQFIKPKDLIYDTIPQRPTNGF